MIKEAENHLAAAREAKEGSSGLSPLRVSHLRALIVARTGRTAKAANNKDGALKSEAAACLSPPLLFRTPSPSPQRAVNGIYASEADSSFDEQDPGEALDADFLNEADEE